jgi:hypothetical protein
MDGLGPEETITTAPVSIAVLAVVRMRAEQLLALAFVDARCDRPEGMRLIANPGSANEAFARTKLVEATGIVRPRPRQRVRRARRRPRRRDAGDCERPMAAALRPGDGPT